VCTGDLSREERKTHEMGRNFDVLAGRGGKKGGVKLGSNSERMGQRSSFPIPPQLSGAWIQKEVELQKG